MLRLLTQDARITCDHMLGVVEIHPSQHLVTIQGRGVLVAPDPEGRPIHGCPNIGPTIKPCTHTLKVQQGYASFVRIQGHAVVMENLRGLTDGTPPGTVHYGVRDPGQDLVFLQKP